MKIYFKALFLVSVVLLTLNFSVVALASDTERHLVAWEFFSSDSTFGWELAVIDLADPWFSWVKWDEIYPNTDR